MKIKIVNMLKKYHIDIRNKTQDLTTKGKTDELDNVYPNK